jgi:hypothetical protein
VRPRGLYKHYTWYAARRMHPPCRSCVLGFGSLLGKATLLRPLKSIRTVSASTHAQRLHGRGCRSLNPQYKSQGGLFSLTIEMLRAARTRQYGQHCPHCL